MVEGYSLNIDSSRFPNTVVSTKRMGMSKDTSDIKKDNDASAPRKSCILITKIDNPEEKVSCKKARSVHFADSLGKPLKSVKTLLDPDDDFDLSFLSLKSTTRRTFPVDIFKKENFGNVKDSKNKLLNFKQPVLSKNFQSRVESDNVCLENVVFRDYGIFATVAVKNISFEKQVSIRYTKDNWLTHDIREATYVPGSSAGITDTFSFEIILPKNENTMEIQFAICYRANDQLFWDSNNGKNYMLQFQQKKNTTYQKHYSNTKIRDSYDNYNGFILRKDNFIGWAT